MPTSSRGMKPRPVSSSISRTTACSRLSPCSRCPEGWLKTISPWACSSTMRKRPSRSTTAATVRSVSMPAGAPLMSDIEPAELVFHLARVPDFVEGGQVHVGDRGHVMVDDAFPARGVQPVDDAAAVGDAIGLAMIAIVLAHVAELDEAVEPAAQGDEAVAVLDGPGGIRDQHAHPGIGAGQDQALDDFEEVEVVVDARLEVVGEDGEAAVGGLGDIDRRPPHLLPGGDDAPFVLFRLLLAHPWKVRWLMDSGSPVGRMMLSGGMPATVPTASRFRARRG